MKQKFLILANSITHDMELEIYEADFTKSDLSDEDIKYELNDTCAALNQAFMNTLILTEDDIVKLKEKLKLI